MNRLLLPLVALFGMAAPPCSGAPTPPGTVRVELRLLAFAPPSDSGEWFVHDPAAKDDALGVAVHLKTYLNHENCVLTVHGRNLVFTGSQERASMRQPAAQLAHVSLPEGKRELVLMFLPREQDGHTTWQVLAIDDSVRAFPPGSLQILNLSRSVVRIQLEQTNYDFKSGETQVITDPPVGPNHHSAMTSFALTSGEWRRIGSGLWPHPGHKRSVQVLFDDPASGQVQLRGFRDVVEKDSPAAPPH